MIISLVLAIVCFFAMSIYIGQYLATRDVRYVLVIVLGFLATEINGAVVIGYLTE